MWCERRKSKLMERIGKGKKKYSLFNREKSGHVRQELRHVLCCCLFPAYHGGVRGLGSAPFEGRGLCKTENIRGHDPAAQKLHLKDLLLFCGWSPLTSTITTTVLWRRPLSVCLVAQSFYILMQEEQIPKTCHPKKINPYFKTSWEQKT